LRKGFNVLLNVILSSHKNFHTKKSLILGARMKSKILIGVLVVLLLGIGIYDYISKQESLLTSARDGKVKSTEELLKSSKRGIEERDSKGRTPLMLSAVSGEAKITKMLVDAGADLKAKDSSGLDAMQTAIRFLRPSVISVLLDAGMDPNSKILTGKDCLMVAVQKGDRELVKKLINAKADLNAKSQSGRTAFGFALEAGDDEIIAAFLDAGIAAEEALAKDETFFARMAASGQVKTIGLIFDKGLVKAGNSSSLTKALGYVAADGHLELMDRILKTEGINVNQPDENGNTPLLLAVTGGKLEAINKLLDARADINAINKNGRNALIIISANPKPSTVKLLIDKGIKVDIADSEGKTPLMALTSCKCPEAVESAKMLVAAKANINAQDTDGWTALMYAVQNNNFEVAKTLVDLGADVNLKTKDDRSAQAIAEQKKREDMIALFTKK
jgi:serine/threonine-protein phosphatase 6 regulatory ankyrin repeat subunit B